MVALVVLAAGFGSTCASFDGDRAGSQRAISSLRLGRNTCIRGVSSGTAWELRWEPAMAASAPARRVVTALVAITAATAVGTPGAHAAHHDHRGVKRLWSQFPLGPQLQTQTAAQAPAPRSPRPPTSAHSRAPAHGVRSDSGDTAWWPWAGIAGAAGVLVAAIAGLKRRRGPRRAAPGTGGAVPPPARAEADP